MYNFEALNDDERAQMLKDININSVDELFCDIKERARIKEFNMPAALSELQAQKKLKQLSKQNNTDYISFLGGGAYQRFIPSALADTASRWEFLSAYTPYQSEISQGSLQIMYEFQTMMCALTNQDVSNASVYDGASACAEAILMACRITKKHKAFVSKNLNPNYIEVIKTYMYGADVELIIDNDCADIDLACKLYQTPDYFGEITQMPDKNADELIIACTDVMSLALIEPPLSDISVGDFQSLGLGLNFGGAYGGFICCRDKYKRQLPGRIAGKTLDKEGTDAYVLTLQTREQHIRREKATSNICSNQALMALSAVLYLSLLGQKGLREAAFMSYKNAHNLADGISKHGYKVLGQNFFNEFVFEVPNSDDFLARMKKHGILAGIKLDETKILTAATELNDQDEINEFLNCL